MSIKGLTPILYASDFKQSMDYFVEKLGFRKLWDWGTPPTFGAVGLDKIEIFLCQGEQGQEGTWMSIFVDDVDEVHEDIAKRGAKIIHGPVDEPWGMREMHVECPDGHVLRIGHGIATGEKRVVVRRPIDARIETHLAALLEDIAAQSKMTLGQLLEDVVLHSFERMDGEEHADCSPTPYARRILKQLDALRAKHGVDYRAHASYGFVEE